jgi:tetratricopeptide (TPR) repeat protein
MAFALTLAATSPALADDAQSAREHYQKGTSYYDLGRYADAIREFEAAYEIKNDPALLYNLAQSHRLAGNSEQALHFYRTYLRRVPKAPNRTEIEGRITALEQLVAQKNTTQTTPPNVTLPPGGTNPPPANTDTTTTNTTTPPPPPNTTTTGPTTTPPADNAQTPPVLTAPVPPPGPPPEPGAGRTLRKAGIVTLAISGGLFLIGAIEGGRAVGAANEVNAAAKNGQRFDPSVESRGKTAQNVEIACIAISLVGAAVGGTLMVVGHKKEQAAAAQVAVSPVASADSVGALLRVTY